MYWKCLEISSRGRFYQHLYAQLFCVQIRKAQKAYKSSGFLRFRYLCEQKLRVNVGEIDPRFFSRQTRL